MKDNVFYNGIGFVAKMIEATRDMDDMGLKLRGLFASGLIDDGINMLKDLASIIDIDGEPFDVLVDRLDDESYIVTNEQAANAMLRMREACKLHALQHKVASEMAASGTGAFMVDGAMVVPVTDVGAMFKMVEQLINEEEAEVQEMRMAERCIELYNATAELELDEMQMIRHRLLLMGIYPLKNRLDGVDPDELTEEQMKLYDAQVDLLDRLCDLDREFHADHPEFEEEGDEDSCDGNCDDCDVEDCDCKDCEMRPDCDGNCCCEEGDDE